MKKWAVIAVIAVAFLGLKMVTAGYVQICTTRVPNTDEYVLDFSSTPLPSPGLQIHVSCEADEFQFILGSDNITITNSYYDNEYHIKVYKNGNLLGENGTGAIGLRVVRITIDENGTATIFASWTEDPGGVHVEVTTNITGSLEKIIGKRTGEGELTISRYSRFLNSLKVVDENTNAVIKYYDFVDLSDGVRVFDITGAHVAREYLVSPGANLTAYLVSTSDGYWYTLQTEPNATIEAMRTIDGAKVVVGTARADEDGVASMYLSNGVLYTFRVSTPGGEIEEYTKVTNPSNPTIVLQSNVLSSTVYKASPFNGISYSFEPSDRILYTGKNNTIVAKVLSEGGNINQVILNFYRNGLLINSTNLTGSPTGGVLTLDVGGNFTTTDKLWATLLITTTTNETLKIEQAFIVKEPLNTTGSLFQVATEAPEKLGIGQLGVVIVLTFVALALAVATGAGERGSVMIVIMLYVGAAILGWVDWVIALLAGLAGVGVLARRGEA